MNNNIETGQILPLWVTPLYISTIPSASSYVDTVKTLPWKRFESNNGCITEDTYILDRGEFQNLKDEVNREIELYIRDVFKIKDKVDFYISNSWAVKHNKGDWSPKHYHTNSLFSGVLYLKCDNSSGSITFYKNSQLNSGIPSCFDFTYSEVNMFNSSFFNVLPKDNTIIIFPSHLEHSVETSNSVEDRFVIAFNVFFKGELKGDSPEKMCDLKIN